MTDTEQERAENAHADRSGAPEPDEPACSSCGEPADVDEMDERGRGKCCQPDESEPPAWEDLD